MRYVLSGLLAFVSLCAVPPTLAVAQFDRVNKIDVSKPDKGGAERPKPARGKTEDKGSKEVEPLPDNGVRIDQHRVQKWKIGVIIRAPGNCSGVFCTVPVPTDWPEQSVKIVQEEISPQVSSVKFRVLEGGVRQMVIDIPQIKAGETVTALITYEVDRSTLRPPLDTTVFQLPNIAKLPKDVRMYLGPSPLIESTHPTLTKVAKEVLEGKNDADAWTKVETIYDWVRGHVEYLEGPIKGALASYKDKKGDCEELTSLFIALCRANKIPARTVWVPDHCYPEFYLVDEQGRGHWIPCQAAGARSFGGIPEFRPVLQKGDNFKVPEEKAAVRYVPEMVKAKNVAANPKVETVRQLLGE